MPEMRVFNSVGGLTLSPEFAALLAGLVIYLYLGLHSGSRALEHTGRQPRPVGSGGIFGFAPGQTLRLVVLPQALRVIIPPTTSQYLKLIKNSSLAVAIGYPDIVSVVNTTLNQTGQAIESILIIMAAYLTVSLSISIFMNWYNKRIALAER